MEGSFESPPVAGEIHEIKMCRCGRAPHRKGQRNCRFCNREANRKYRAELKRMEARLARAQTNTPALLEVHPSDALYSSSSLAKARSASAAS